MLGSALVVGSFTYIPANVTVRILLLHLGWTRILHRDLRGVIWLPSLTGVNRINKGILRCRLVMVQK